MGWESLSALQLASRFRSVPNARISEGSMRGISHPKDGRLDSALGGVKEGGRGICSERAEKTKMGASCIPAGGIEPAASIRGREYADYNHKSYITHGSRRNDKRMI